MKKCPFCAEQIQEEAIKCKCCGEALALSDEARRKYGRLKGNENTIAMWCHLSTFAGILVPFGNFLAPLLIWLSKKDEYPLVDDQGRESLNFQITVFLYSLAGIILTFLIIGFLFLIVVMLFAVIQVIKAGIAASRGQRYRYPFCLRIMSEEKGS
jgi:hypothetical protein